MFDETAKVERGTTWALGGADMRGARKLAEAEPTACSCGHGPSAELLGESDDDALGTADVAEPIDVLVLLQLAHEFGAVSA